MNQGFFFSLSLIYLCPLIYVVIATLALFLFLDYNNPIPTFGPLDLLFPHQCEKGNAFEKSVY